MKRRDFLASSIGAAGMSALGASGGQAQTTNKPMPEYYELRQYHLRTTMREDFSNYLRDVSVPALNRAGINPVGVFTVAFGPDSPTFWVLLPHKDLQSVGGLDAKLQADQDYKTKGAEHHSRPAANPAPTAPTRNNAGRRRANRFASVSAASMPPSSNRSAIRVAVSDSC